MGLKGDGSEATQAEAAKRLAAIKAQAEAAKKVTTAMKAAAKKGPKAQVAAAFKAMPDAIQQATQAGVEEEAATTHVIKAMEGYNAQAAMEAAEDDNVAFDEAARVLGELIPKLNPYTNTRIKDTTRSRGEMSIVNADAVEMEGPYAQEWTFKGQSQRVGMAARIKYKYPVRNEQSEFLYYVEDYILIGFQGTMGG
jgi:hypothetical protein